MLGCILRIAYLYNMCLCCGCVEHCNFYDGDGKDDNSNLARRKKWEVETVGDCWGGEPK
jgi:hypothetical protein